MKVHRTPRATIAAIAISSLLFAACSAEASSNPATAVSAPETTSSTTAAVATTAPARTAAPAATAASTPTPTPTTAPMPTPTPAPTNAPSNPPPTDAPVDSDPAVEEPTFTSFAASNVSVCAAPDVSVPTIARTVTLSWDIAGADSVYVATGNVDGVYEGGLPAAGSIELFVPCPDTQTYYVVAENTAGRTVMEATR